MKKINVTKFLATTLTAATLLTGFEVPSVVKAEDTTNYTEATTTTTTTVTEDVYDTLSEALFNSESFYHGLNNLVFESDKFETVKAKKSISKTFDNTKGSDIQISVLSKNAYTGKLVTNSCGVKSNIKITKNDFTKEKLNGVNYYWLSTDFIVDNSYNTKFTLTPNSDTEVYFVVSRDKVSGEKTKNVVSETPTAVSGASIKAFDEYADKWNYYNGSLNKFPEGAEAVEYHVTDKSGNVVFTNTTYTKNMTVVVKARGIYTLAIRTRNTNSANEKIYSDWKNVKTFITEPAIDYNKSSFKNKATKAHLVYSKVPGATKYEIFGAYENQKYKKLATTNKTTFDVAKVNGKKINHKKNVYFYVVAVTKVNGKEIKSRTHSGIVFDK